MKEGTPPEPLMPIGSFSRMTRLSIKALRLYDEMGLLEPKWVDGSSGYRYYSSEQAHRAEAIRTLRAMDMPLEEIRQVLVLGPERAAGVLETHRRRLVNRLVQDERRLSFLGDLIDGRKQIMPYDIAVKEIGDQQVAALRITTTLETVGQAVPQGFGTLMHTLGTQGASPVAAPFIIYHDVIDEETDGDIEMCVPIAAPIDDANGVVGRVIAGGSVAATVHKGAYQDIGPAYHALSTWISEHGHQFAGPPRETYLNDPTEVAEEDLLTEVSWPIDSAA